MTCVAHARRAMKVMRARLWPILARARRAENPPPASLAIIAASLAREPEIEAQAPVVGDKRAHEADERCAEKAVRRAKADERDRIGPGGDMGRDDVAEDDDAVLADEPAKQNEQRIECLGREILRDRMQHH